MWNDWLRSLSARSGLLILVGAAALTVVLSAYFYQRIFNEQLIRSDRQLQQLVATVESSAAVATYLDNEEMATEVLRGLASNEIVASASLESAAGMRVITGDVAHFSESELRQFTLRSPFLPDESVGTLSLRPNRKLIENNAREVALVYVYTLGAHSLVLTLLTILIMRWLLTRPLNDVAQRLHVIEPGSDARLPMLPAHKHDEVGQLIDDINGVLDATQLTLEGERRLRQYVESVEKRFRLVFDHASCGIGLVNPQGRIILSNPSFIRIMAIPEEFLSDETMNFVHMFDDASQVRELLEHAISENSPISADLQLSGNHENGRRWLHALFSSVQDEQGQDLIECILYDISERTEREQRTRQEAERDALTQLYNRRAGERKLQEALHLAAIQQETCALMLIDLDRFKPINDTYGHEAGDLVLIAIARRLTRSLRKQDIVIRWGGDEFVVLIHPGKDIEAIPVVAEKLLHQLSQPVELGIGITDHVGASIGIALFPLHNQDLNELIVLADKAMYQVKQRGRNHFLIYQPPIPSKVSA